MIFHVTNITVFTHYEKDLDIYFVRFYKTDTHENWISPFTKEELAELEAAKKMPITFDADCPETTPERAVKFRRVNPPRNRMNAHGA